MERRFAAGVKLKGMIPCRPWLALSLLLLWPACAPAQVLPAPAAKGGDVPLNAPPSDDSPLVIGDPVRHQGVVVAPSTALAATSGTVAGVSVARLSDAAAIAKLRAALAPQLKAPFRTVIGSYQYTFGRDELGATLPLREMLTRARRGETVALSFSVNRAKLDAALRELDGQVREDFGNVGLNIEASAAKIEVALEQSPPKARESLVTVAVRETAPTPDEAPQIAVGKGAFPYLLTSFSTKYDASLRGRTVNLRMAANHINGTVVPPGGVFSTNTAIGPRNAESGWREAKMFVSGRVVAGTGAGICQAASTLYNCALLGNFPIVERHAHSMRVSYVPPSRDAALMWHQKDFRFRNTSGGPIRVETFVANGKFNARVWGQKPRRAPKVELVSLVTSREGGTHSQAFKLVGGQRVKLSSDFYRPHP